MVKAEKAPTTIPFSRLRADELTGGDLVFRSRVEARRASAIRPSRPTVRGLHAAVRSLSVTVGASVISNKRTKPLSTVIGWVEWRGLWMTLRPLSELGARSTGSERTGPLGARYSAAVGR